jgi:hypothetical protein
MAPPAPPPGGPPRRQEPTGATTPPTAPQGQPHDTLKSYVGYYRHFSDSDLEREADRLQRSDPLSMSVTTAQRLQAIRLLLAQRQGTLPGGPLPPALTPEEN